MNKTLYARGIPKEVKEKMLPKIQKHYSKKLGIKFSQGETLTKLIVDEYKEIKNI